VKLVIDHSFITFQIGGFMQIQLQLELAALAALILSIFAGVVSITRYITRLQFKVKTERLQVEKELADKRHSDLDAKYRELLDEVAVARRVGTAVLAKRIEVESGLSTVMKTMLAQAGSVYVPLLSKGSSEPSGLVFLAILPFGQETRALRRKIIPMKSLAGRCFTTGEPFVVSNSKRDPSHFDRADQVSGFHTEDTLNIPLRYQGNIIGVLQLLNKQGSERFNSEDQSRVMPFTDALAVTVNEFVQIPDSFEILGVMPEREADYATVMFCDITNSSLLFQEMNASAAIQHINEYLEKLCDIAFKYGATVDKYLGDGVMFRFNVPHPIKDQQLKAVKAALEMRTSFSELRQDWLTMGELVNNLYLRIGIAYGSIQQAIVGHPQYQYLTIFGQPVNVAANLCDIASRNKDAIVIDDQIYNKFPEKLKVTQVPKEMLGKVKAFIRQAYELTNANI
jgi:class 3 adenylate cyclase